MVAVPVARGHARGSSGLAGLAFPARWAAAGCARRKREGDGATPIGRWRLREVLYRADRLPSPAHAACRCGRSRPARRLVRRRRRPQLQPPGPPSLSGERRAAVARGWALRRRRRARPQRRPRVRGRGSAIFMHVAGPGYAPTEGCIALQRAHLLRLLRARCRAASASGPRTKSARVCAPGAQSTYREAACSRCGEPMERGPRRRLRPQ